LFAELQNGNCQLQRAALVRAAPLVAIEGDEIQRMPQRRESPREFRQQPPKCARMTAGYSNTHGSPTSGEPSGTFGGGLISADPEAGKL
jgi:hypothetical protein